ncbi:unnamed protein product [Colias eurytheme]|nr:unnamed protein product [Colias eurytheme]
MFPPPEKFDKKLIKLVRENPVLYDNNHVKYMDFNSREVAWQKIGDELKRPASDCKDRWINIRDVYRRILRQLTNNKGSRRKQYKYEKEMSFLRPFYRDIVHISEEDSDRGSDHINDTCEGRDSCEDSDEPIKPKVEKTERRRKKKREVIDMQEQESSPVFADTSGTADFDSSDPVDAFLLSIGATLRTFSPYHLNVAKSKIFSIVQEHDLQQIVQKQRSDTSHGHDIKLSSSDIFMQ